MSVARNERRITIDIQGNLNIYDCSEIKPNESIEGKPTMYDLKLRNLM